MKLKDMFDRILVESGQFMMKEDIELDIDKFRILINSALSTYSQYSPHHAKFNLNVTNLTNNFGGIIYKFSDGENPNPPAILDDETFSPVPKGIPDWISDIIPVRLAGVHPWYFRQKEEWTNKELEYKRQFPWEYIKPTLYVPVQSVYEVTAVYRHKVEETAYKDPHIGVIRKELEVSTITDHDDDFFELLRGRFMVALGRNRRAFTLNELPITMDSADLVSEGTELITSAMDKLENKSSKFWLAYR